MVLNFIVMLFNSQALSPSPSGFKAGMNERALDALGAFFHSHFKIKVAHVSAGLHVAKKLIHLCLFAILKVSLFCVLTYNCTCNISSVC